MGGRFPRNVRVQLVELPDPAEPSLAIITFPSPGVPHGAQRTDRAGAGASAPLSVAERDILRLLWSGSSNAEIATLRGTSPRTVANQIAGLLRKLGVSSRHELALAALEK